MWETPQEVTSGACTALGKSRGVGLERGWLSAEHAGAAMLGHSDVSGGWIRVLT